MARPEPLVSSGGGESRLQTCTASPVQTAFSSPGYGADMPQESAHPRFVIRGVVPSATWLALLMSITAPTGGTDVLMATPTGPAAAAATDTSTATWMPRRPSGRVSAGCDPAPPREVDCGLGKCDRLHVLGDPYASTPGTFRGYSDPHLAAGPEVPGRLWLSYSWLDVQDLVDLSGRTVQVAVVRNHLATSDDGGGSFRFVSELWPSIPTADPEGSGEQGLLASETASTAWIGDPSGRITWYGAHLRYFLRPVQGYHPRFATSYTIRVGAASTPEELTAAPEAVLGVSSTSPVYDPDIRLDALVGVPLADCAITNNPTLFAHDGTLYLAFECLAFSGTMLRPERSSIQLIATEPWGPPPIWTWRHAGVIADGVTFAELGVELLQQPDLAVGPGGELLLTVTPARENPDTVEHTHLGMRVLELDRLDPPLLARDCQGGPAVHAVMDAIGLGGCTYSVLSSTGVVCHSVQTTTEPRHVVVTGLHPVDGTNR